MKYRWVAVAALCVPATVATLWVRASSDTLAAPAVVPPVGLALEIENGVGVPLAVKAGQEFYVDQLDVRAFLETSVDEGVAGLATTGDFAGVPWDDVALADREPGGLPNSDGTWVRRSFYRGAKWMELPSTFVITPVDADGRPVAAPVTLNAGADDRRNPGDGFFVRRFRAIQWGNDCPTLTDCTGATDFEEEALIELRHALRTTPTIRFTPEVAALTVRWSMKADRPWTIPVTQVEEPGYAYGFRMDVEPLTPPGPDGSYAPGTDVTFRLTLRDGAGERLHPEGSLPTYEEVVFGLNEPGIQYYRAFFDPTTTYYRRKHRERMLMVHLIGPAQDVQPIRTIAELEQFLGPDDTLTVGLPTRDGVFSEAQTIPAANDLFGGAFNPAGGGWQAPVPDVFTFHLPPDAQPGTYYLSAKGRRTYLGQDVPLTETIELQVGTPARTEPSLGTGGCNACHTGPSSLAKVLHANSNRAACAGCHVPLAFELEGPIAVRLHFIHSRSDRFDAPLFACSTCHRTGESIQRTSKAACLSCHTSYPESHVDWFGPVESMYIGGGRESFEQCTDACHTTHPGSGFDDV